MSHVHNRTHRVCCVRTRCCGTAREAGASYTRPGAKGLSGHPGLELPQEKKGSCVWLWWWWQYFQQKTMESEAIQFRGIFKSKNID